MVGSGTTQKVKAEKVEEMRKRTKEEEEEEQQHTSGKREVKGEIVRVAVVCKRAWCGSRSSLSGKVFEEFFEEDVVEGSGSESERWCEVGVCVPVSVPSVPSLISLVDMVCGLDLWVSDFEVEEP